MARQSGALTNHRGKRGAIHRVSAWAHQAGLSLGQVKTEAKSNEITAIPMLLKLPELKGCIVTIDAMGCQTDIASCIVNQQAGYVLAVKDNQKRLHEAISDYFDVAIASGKPDLCQLQYHEETTSGRGRIETRRCYLSTCLGTLPDADRWQGLAGIGRIESERCINGEMSIERRHYICSLTDVKAFGRIAPIGHKGRGE